MYYLRCTFAQAVAAFGWRELVNFARHLPEDSATHRELNGDAYNFARNLQQSSLLADIYDAIMAFCFLFGKAHGANGAAPKPYPRPWETGSAQKVGKGAIPISDFEKWYYGGD